VPIDVNVAFPPAPASGPDGSFPLVMMFHGYGGSKLGLGDMHRWLDKGYATFSMTTRGFNESCGNATSVAADPTGCAAGYIRLMDTRYEVRDAQDFAGVLADEGLVSPTKIGATGGSYGGGMSMALGALKDRQMKPDGSLIPWTSPHGTPMSIAAAAPEVPWTDLAYALTPNGSTLDYVADAPYAGRIGVYKSSFTTGLYVLGCVASGRCVAEGGDPAADITSWNKRINAGEPYDGDASVTAILEEIKAHHSSYYIDHSQPPAAMLISNGWTDDLFPVDEAIRFYNRTKSEHPDAPVALFFLDYGHMRGQNKAADIVLLAAAEEAWLDYYVKGVGSLPFQGVETLTQTCPSTAPSAGPYMADDWAQISKGEVRFKAAAAKTIMAAAGDAAIGRTFDPVTGPGACAQAAGDDQPGTATYRLPVVTGDGYTLMGAATVQADLLTDTNCRWRRARRRPGRQGRRSSPVGLAPEDGAWLCGRSSSSILAPHFVAGHTAKLELLPSDAPYGRPSDGQQAVVVKKLRLTLPVLEEPRRVVKQTSRKVVPKGYELAPEFRKKRHGKA
jgi:hypothetical protein